MEATGSYRRGPQLEAPGGARGCTRKQQQSRWRVVGHKGLRYQLLGHGHCRYPAALCLHWLANRLRQPGPNLYPRCTARSAAPDFLPRPRPPPDSGDLLTELSELTLRATGRSLLLDASALKVMEMEILHLVRFSSRVVFK